jgi:superfamily II DNA or RNA helicase
MKTGPPPRKRRPRARRCRAKSGKEASGLCRTNTSSPDTKQAISLELRPYQQEAVAAAIKGFDEFKRQLLVCPTGSGKTVIFAMPTSPERLRQ